MQIKLIILSLCFLISLPVFAAKPEWAGKGKPAAEQKESHRAAMKSQDDSEQHEELDDKKEKKEKKEKISESNGLEKQYEKKFQQPREEPDNWSQQG